MCTESRRPTLDRARSWHGRRMTLTTEDREALLLERIHVHSVHVDQFGLRVYATGPDDDAARNAIIERLGAHVEVEVCGDAPRESRPRACNGHREREPGRLQLRYHTQREEHVDLILVAETDTEVVVFGTVCTPVGLLPGHETDCPYHVYLDQPLGERQVIDAVVDAPVPYFNVYDGIEKRVSTRRARPRTESA
jgi:hypothetical protein